MAINLSEIAKKNLLNSFNNKNIRSLVRLSGTEPLVRILVEGKNKYLVKENSIIKKGTSVNFIITDLKEEIAVSYEGILPNLFSEGKGVVAEGKLRDPKYFVADTILAKHDENYMPPEVSDALKKSND